MRINRTALFLICLALLLACATPLFGQDAAVVVFSDSGFPAADTASPSAPQLQSLFSGAQFVSVEQLKTTLSAPGTRLLVLPYGSAFPEEVWGEVNQFLQHGGNLLVLGGRPFTRAAYRDGSGWHLRDYGVRFTRPLMIDQYQETPGSESAEFQTNPEVPLQLARFSWKRGFSPVIRLSAVDLYKRGGAAGAIDARLDPLAWGVKDGSKMSAPAIQIDHMRNGFNGGRWVFLNAELADGFYGSAEAANIVRALTNLALQGSQEFTVRPALPLYLPGEPVQLDVQWSPAQISPGPLTLKIALYPEDQPSSRAETSVALPSGQVVLPAPSGKGLYVVEAKLMEGAKVRAIYHSGFWIRDELYLRTGPKMTVNGNYFELDGQPLAVIGTTYMSSEVQRLYFEYPNVYVWNREMGEIHSAGLNMVRSGWWTGWDKFCNENGQPYERTMRTLEAYLMTARKNGLPIQFNFFAFLPDVLGGTNPYLDQEAVRRQRTLISSIVARFHDVPWLAWDFINEPSISQYLWRMRPNGDGIELQKWNEWLNKRYPDRAALAAAWNIPATSAEGTLPLPEEIEFTPRGAYVGRSSLKLYDYFLFSQEVFANWVKTMRDAVRATGSRQLVTVGQDEGGIADRLSPAYWGEYVDFTTNHSWWQNDHVLWDSFMAKQPGKTMLIQETGLQRELNLDEVVRREPDAEGSLLERKVAASFVHGSGAIEWLWNMNSYMTESNETPIGLIRPDATEKPETKVMRNYATFAASLSKYLRNPQQPSIAIVTSQAAQFSVFGDMQLDAQRKAVRALTYNDHLTAYAIAENQIDKLGSPKLAILPSAQALTDKAWRALLKYANDGGNLLITGPIERDEHWHQAHRIAELKLGAKAQPLMYHNATIKLKDRSISLAFNQQAQNYLEALRFADGSNFKEIFYGKGRIFWTADPVELSEAAQATADLYAYVATQLSIVPAYDSVASLPAGVLAYPIVLDDSVLYVMISDSADDAKVDLRDKLTGARLTLQLASQHAAIAVIGKKEKAVVAKYGF